MQDPNSKPCNQPGPVPFRNPHHRRAQSEVNFRLPDNLDLVPDQFGSPVDCNFEEMGSEDDFFSTYMDIEKLGGSNSNDGGSGDNAGGGVAVESNGDGENEMNLTADVAVGGSSRPRHRYSSSMDGSSLMLSESIDAKKAMAPDKLAELWNLDPKRAKRILANRQSAARSKERKARYINELERKVQTLQTEATTLAAQLTMYQRDTTGLTTENTQLKVRLQSMEQQAQLRDHLNETLKSEVERLRRATGESAGVPNAFNLQMQHVPYDQSALFARQPQPGRNEIQNTQMQQFNLLPPNMSNHQLQMLAANHAQTFSDTLNLQDPLGRFQGLDIGSRGSHLMKPEGPSISASESSSGF